VLFGKYRGTAGGRIEVRGTSGGGPLRQVVEVRPADVRAENGALRWLWARRWVETLDDERAMGAGQPAEEAITTLGLDYRLLTAFTSFVAIDSQVVNAGGQGHNVRQPLPMPEGVSNLAVGPSQAMAPPPPGIAPMKAMGGAGYGHAAKRRSAPAAADEENEAPADRSRALAKREAKPESKEKTDKAGKGKDGDDARKSQAASWTVTAGKSSGVGASAPLLAAIRAALMSDRSACLAAAAPGQTVTLRLTIDAKGRIVSVQLVAGDRAVESCLQKALGGLSSATVAQGTPTGTIEIVLRH
jgi:Ca-activated chloride channel family protein